MRVAFTFDLQTEASEGQAEFDTPETVEWIAGALRRLGHEVACINTSKSLFEALDVLRAFEPELIFNTSEGRAGRGRESLFPAIFEHLDIPYTGSDAHVCAVTLDKRLTKSIVERYGVRTPGGCFVQSVDRLEGWRFPYPVIVKPNFEGSSKGITDKSVVSSDIALRRRVAELLEAYPEGVLIEQFIGGIDVVVPYLENANPAHGGVLEPASYEYRSANEHRIYDLSRKLDGFDDLQVVLPAAITSDQRARLMLVTRRIIGALGIRDFARLDFRLDEAGWPYFLEVNALPSLEKGASIYAAGALVGLRSVDAVLDAIIRSALRRRGMPEPQTCQIPAHAPASSG